MGFLADRIQTLSDNCETARRERGAARREVERLKAAVPSERAIVIEPRDTTNAHNMCLAVAWLQANRAGYRSDSAIDIIYSLVNQSRDYVDAEVELLSARTPIPDPPKTVTKWKVHCTGHHLPHYYETQADALHDAVVLRRAWQTGHVTVDCVKVPTDE